MLILDNKQAFSSSGDSSSKRWPATERGSDWLGDRGCQPRVGQLGRGPM